jgi:pilus assembly protein CpaE
VSGSGASSGDRDVRVSVAEGAIGGPDRFASLAALFPQTAFSEAGVVWPDPRASGDILIVAADASSATDIDAVGRLLKSAPVDCGVVVVLKNADVMTTRRLLREGAADVLPAPASEPALAVSIERLLGARGGTTQPDRKTGEVVAFLKAGGGVGATSIVTQVAALLAKRDAGKVCVADIDLQFGAAAIYLDLADALTLDAALTTGHGLAETSFASVLAAHRSGARVLAAPRDITPLEAVTPAQAEALITALRRDFALTLLDLPSVWTAWTNRMLHEADRIVIVTQLSVAHVQQVKRQMRLLTAQGLDERPLVVVCNAVNADQQGQVSLRVAERALGRPFDAVLPEDRKVMCAAINQGAEIGAIRRGTKLEKAIVELSEKVLGGAFATAQALGARR